MSMSATGAMAVTTLSTFISLCCTCCEKILSPYLLSFVPQLPVSIFLRTLTQDVLFVPLWFLSSQYPIILLT